MSPHMCMYDVEHIHDTNDIISYLHVAVDSLRGSSVKLGTTQNILACPLRKDDTHTLRGVNNFVARGYLHVADYISQA